ncbi:uncharacterized protein EDB91DRAFT_1079978 [Suillus paluster]|uniref:uncharacterized protein n=1 Tax=Suillus paluster TaxID=48578 RepID=UPI001B8828AB|nr:uncharacterized protein EDB91DRAFT_1079978 [Suillus paluster]KAG1746663.1 hypothetical protein EDB91DRAFT_1079978 [Suillus paluster]
MTGHPLSKCNLCAKVSELSKKLKEKKRLTGKDLELEKNWIECFLTHHPEIKLGCPTGIDPKQMQMFNFTTVNHHFKLLVNFLKSKGIPWENVYNMDEKEIQLGGGRKCNNTNGTSLKPGFVFSGSDIYPEYYEEDGIIVATSENGWTSDFIGTEWFIKSFVPQAKAWNSSGSTNPPHI